MRDDLTINRWLDTEGDISNKSSYSFSTSFYDDEDDEEYIDDVELPCADYFTAYSNRTKFNTLEVEGVNSIKDELPDVYFLLNKFNANIVNGNIIKGEKHKLIFYFRIIRLISRDYLVDHLNIIINIIKNHNIPPFTALFVSYLHMRCKDVYEYDKSLDMIYQSNKHRKKSFRYFIQPIKNILDNIIKSKTDLSQSKLQIYINPILSEKEYLKTFNNGFRYLGYGFDSHSTLFNIKVLNISFDKTAKRKKEIIYKLNKAYTEFNNVIEDIDNLILNYNKLIKQLKEI